MLKVKGRAISKEVQIILFIVGTRDLAVTTQRVFFKVPKTII